MAKRGMPDIVGKRGSFGRVFIKVGNELLGPRIEFIPLGQPLLSLSEAPRDLRDLDGVRQATVEDVSDLGGRDLGDVPESQESG